MGAEQRINASAFTHRGDDFTSNNSNFLLDGRQPFDFELDNSHVSIADLDRNFFFAVCDTKITDNLNTSVSGIKELKKLHAQLKTGARDIKSNTEILGECFIETEDLLYDTAGYATRDAVGPAAGERLSSLDKRLVSYAGKDISGEGDQDDDIDDPGDEYSSRGPSAPHSGPVDGDDVDDDFVDEDERDFDDDEEDDDFDDIEPPEIVDQEPGKKGFSSVGFILSDKKGSILAQGECEAFMFRGGSLRVLSGGSKKVSVTLNRGAAAGQGQQSRNKGAQAKPYGGRSSEIFEPREGDIYMLCTTSVVESIGEENIDSYLSMNDSLAEINGTIMFDAVKGDPSSNMTCMLVKIDEIIDDEASPDDFSARRGADYDRQDMYGYGNAPGSGGGMGSSAGGGGGIGGGGAAAAGIGGAAGMGGSGSSVGMRQGQGVAQGQGVSQGQGQGQGISQGQGQGMGQGPGYGYGPPAGQTAAGQGGRYMQGAPSYMEQQDTRISQMPYQNRDAFSKRATSRFDAPPRKISLTSNRSLITSIITTVALISILFLSYFIIKNNSNNEPSGDPSQRTTTTSAAVAGNTTTTSFYDDEYYGDDDEVTQTQSHSSTQGRTTTTTVTTVTTTTEPPEQEYIVKSGDTLTKIAQRFYGNANSNLYTLIQERNTIQNAHDIKIGQTLIIPPMPTTTTEAVSQNNDAGEDGQDGGGAATAARQSATTTRR